MNRQDFLDFVESRRTARMDLLQKKGAAYSGMDDAFSNFKRNGERLGLSKYQIWLVYFTKHIDAITNGIKVDPARPVDHSEGMTGRIDDAVNYLDLLDGMLREDLAAAIGAARVRAKSKSTRPGSPL